MTWLPDPLHVGPVEQRLLNQQVRFTSCLDQVSGAINPGLLTICAKKELLKRLYSAIRKESSQMRK